MSKARYNNLNFAIYYLYLLFDFASPALSLYYCWIDTAWIHLFYAASPLKSYFA